MEQGTPIELAVGQEVRDINVALPRGGVLTGLLFDPFGDPVTGATVRALRFRYTSGTWRLSPIGRGNQTDDRGAFAVRGLPPARYLALAAQSIPEGSWTNPQFLERLVPFAERFQLRAGEDMRIALPVRTLR